MSGTGLEDPRRRILQAAGPVFAEKGFQATVREICQAAEVNLAAVNYYFGDKERLYIETVKQASRSRAEQFPYPQWSLATPPEERLRDFVRTLVKRMLEAEGVPWQVRLMLREVLQPTAACVELVEEYFRPQFETLLQILGEMLPADASPAARRRIAFSVVGQCLFYRVAGEVAAMLTPPREIGDSFRPEVLAEHISQFTLAALGREK